MKDFHLLFLALCFLFTSCGDKRMSLDKSVNFNVLIEKEFETIDLKNGIYKRCFLEGEKVINFQLTAHEIQLIFKKTYELGIFDLPLKYNPFGYGNEAPVFSANVYVSNFSNTHEINLRSVSYFFADWYRVKRVNELIQFIDHIVTRKESISSLPSSNCALE